MIVQPCAMQTFRFTAPRNSLLPFRDVQIEDFNLLDILLPWDTLHIWLSWCYWKVFGVISGTIYYTKDFFQWFQYKLHLRMSFFVVRLEISAYHDPDLRCLAICLSHTTTQMHSPKEEHRQFLILSLYSGSPIWEKQLTEESWREDISRALMYEPVCLIGQHRLWLEDLYCSQNCLQMHLNDSRLI